MKQSVLNTMHSDLKSIYPIHALSSISNSNYKRSAFNLNLTINESRSPINQFASKIAVRQPLLIVGINNMVIVGLVSYISRQHDPQHNPIHTQHHARHIHIDTYANFITNFAAPLRNVSLIVWLRGEETRAICMLEGKSQQSHTCICIRIFAYVNNIYCPQLSERDR